MKKTRILYVFFYILILIFIICTYYNKSYNSKNILMSVKKYDSQCEEIMKQENILSYTVVLYRTNNINKIMIFYNDDFYGKSSSSKAIGIYSATNSSTLLIVYGQKEDDYTKYDYTIDEITLTKQIKSDSILDVYVLPQRYDTGYGNVFDKNNQIIDTF